MKVPPWGGDSRVPKGKNFVKKKIFYISRTSNIEMLIFVMQHHHDIQI